MNGWWKRVIAPVIVILASALLLGTFRFMWSVDSRLTRIETQLDYIEKFFNGGRYERQTSVPNVVADSWGLCARAISPGLGMGIWYGMARSAGSGGGSLDG